MALLGHMINKRNSSICRRCIYTKLAMVLTQCKRFPNMTFWSSDQHEVLWPFEKCICSLRIHIFTRLFLPNRRGRLLTLGIIFSTQTLTESSSTSCYIICCSSWWRALLFPCIFWAIWSFIFRLKNKIKFLGKRNIIFLDINKQEWSYSSALYLGRPCFQNIWKMKIWFSM